MSGPLMCRDLGIGWWATNKVLGSWYSSSYTNDARGYLIADYTSCDGYAFGLDIDAPNPFARILSESICVTNAWTNRLMSRQYQVLTNSLPVLTYYTTGSIPGGSVTVAGWVTNEYHPESEVVALSGTNTALTIPFATVTNLYISCTGAPGDSLQARYTNNRAQYSLEINGGKATVLDAHDLDQRWKILDSMRWIIAPQTWIGTSLTWTANGSPSDWAGVKAACEAATPTTDTNYTGPPCCHTYAYLLNDGILSVRAVSARSAPVFDLAANYTDGPAWSNMNHTGHTYYSVTNPTSSEDIYTYDSQGGTAPSPVNCIERDAITSGKWRSETGAFVGTLAFPATWCRQPTNRTPGLGGNVVDEKWQGWTISDPDGIIKWDVTGGFEYK